MLQVPRPAALGGDADTAVFFVRKLNSICLDAARFSMNSASAETGYTVAVGDILNHPVGPVPFCRQRARVNAFKVNGETKNVGDALFLFLLRLVVGLFEGKENDGYVRNSDFDVYEEMHLSARELDGQVSRLRQHLRGSVEDVKQFIDRTKRGYTRLGVHPALITFNRTKLIAHPNKPIRKLAERLPVMP